MKVLLVNPNAYQRPPVPPLALEHLEAALEAAGHESFILDLTFEPAPEQALVEALERFRPEVAGVTVRNVDTCIYRGNQFFLDGIQRLVRVIRDYGVPVVAGGAGFSMYGQAALDYLGADYGVTGPGERTFPELLEALAAGARPGRLTDGWARGFDPSQRMNGRGRNVDYPTYLARGGLAGFETQKGCLGRCPFCAEATPRVFHRDPEAILEELLNLTEKGVNEFHLCDSEFNQDLEFCHLFLETLCEAKLPLRWALYLKDEPFDMRLFERLAESGAWLVTLNLPGIGSDWEPNAARIASLCRDNGIRLAVDFLCGLPGETRDTILRDLDRLRAVGPDTVGLNSVIRLVPGTPITRRVLEDRAARPFLQGAGEDNPGFVRPAFYHRIGPDELKELAGDDPLFGVEGFEKGSNYQRV